MAGCPAATPPARRSFFEENGLIDFYWGLGGPGRQGSFGIYGSGGSYRSAGPTPARVNYPAEVFLPVRTVKYGGERVIDFSNPLTVKLERERDPPVGDGPGEEHRPRGNGFLRLVGQVARDSSILS